MGCARPVMSSRRGASSSPGRGHSAMAATSSIQGVASSAPESEAGGRRSIAFGGAPALDQRPRIAMDRVVCGQRNRGDPRQEVRAYAVVLVGEAGRGHDDITSAQLHRLAALATQSHADPTGGDAEDLVRAAVIVMMRIDPV